MMVKVGLHTTFLTLNSLQRACTKVVFPAPIEPCKAKTLDEGYSDKSFNATSSSWFTESTVNRICFTKKNFGTAYREQEVGIVQPCIKVSGDDEWMQR